jgi:DNA polymerase III subunit delta'
MTGMSWDLIGQTWAEEMLRQHIAADSLRHAYLFSGPRGVGRRTLALHFAQAINCPTPLENGQPCGTCRICRQIADMQQADLNILQAEEEGGTLKVDEVRDLQHMLSLAPYESAYRIALLLRFEEANASAQNALLKTLEEPNRRVILLVTADDPENLLPTIVSRCELMRLRPLPLDDLAAVLREKRDLEEDRARLIAHIAGGRPGYALRLIDDNSLLDTREESLQSCLKIMNYGKIERFLFVEKLTRRRDRAEAKNELRGELGHWLSFWRDVMLTSYESQTPIANLDYEQQIQEIASKIPHQKAAQVVADMEHAFVRMNTANLQIMLDNLLLAWPRIAL